LGSRLAPQPPPSSVVSHRATSSAVFLRLQPHRPPHCPLPPGGRDARSGAPSSHREPCDAPCPRATIGQAARSSPRLRPQQHAPASRPGLWSACAHPGFPAVCVMSRKGVEPLSQKRELHSGTRVDMPSQWRSLLVARCGRGSPSGARLEEYPPADAGSNTWGTRHSGVFYTARAAHP
jgi:hypothetical protein